VEWAGANLITYSNAFASGSWYLGGTPATLTPNYAVGPDGITGSAWRFQGALSNSVFAQPILNNGFAHVVSIYAKSNVVGSNQTFGIYNGTSFVSCTATNVWQRFEVSVAATWAYAYFGTVGASQDILIWGAQSNLGSTAQTYYPTTTAAYHAPRFNYSPTNIGQPRGLLIEGSSINYMLQSTALDPHSVNGMRTISTASITDPEGTTNKARIIAADASTSFHARFLATTAGTNTTITVSIFAKKNGYKYLYLADLANGRSAVRFDLDDGTTSNSVGLGFVSASATSYPNGWWRCSMVATVSASTSYAWSYVGSPTTGAVLSAFGSTYNGTNTDSDGIYCYGFSVEGGSGASSYIPTGASQVTRAVDTAIIAAGTNFSSWYTGGTTGTFVTEWCRCSPTTTQRTVIATSDVSNQHLHQYIAATTSRLRLADKVPAFIETANASVDNSINKGAFSYSGSVQSLCLNGGTVVPGTLTFTTAPTWLSIGGPSIDGTSITDTAVVLNNAIRKIKYFPTRLSDAKIKEITT
jgi:hypothetical protein